MTGPRSLPAAPPASRERPPPALPFVGPRVVAVVGSLVGFLVLLVMVTATGGTDAPDLDLVRALTAVRSPALTSVAHAVTTLGSFPVVVAVALLASALLARQNQSLLSSAVLLTSVALAAATVYLLKVAVGRTRPPVDALLGNPSLDGSFPSGHTTDGAVLYVLTALLTAPLLRTRATRRLLVAAAVLVALAIGVSRVYLGFHWPSDVLAGWFLAAAVVLSATIVVRLTMAG